jgi:hypothetical protein
MCTKELGANCELFVAFGGELGLTTRDQVAVKAMREIWSDADHRRKFEEVSLFIRVLASKFILFLYIRNLES